MKKVALCGCLLAVGVSLQAAAAPAKKIDARLYGAIGDGRVNNRVALQTALDAAAAAGGGEVDLPAGVYLTGSLVLKSHVTLNLDKRAVLLGSPDPEEYPVITARWEGIERPCHRALVSADGAMDIGVVGLGTIQGDGSVGKLRDPRGPTLIEPIRCQNVRVEGLLLKNTQVWTLHPTYCQNVTVSNVRFDTKEVNSDGIDPDSCRNVRIDGCVFSSGDDNIAIKSGKGQEGVRIARPCTDIVITNCTFNKGTSSIALGSELSGGIERVRVSNCVFKRGRAALYLKSREGRAGYVRDVTVDHIDVGSEPLLEIETTYSSNPDSQGVPGPEGLTSFSRIHISNVKADGKRLVRVFATPEKPVVDLTLTNIAGRCEQGFQLSNVRGAALTNIRLSRLKGPALYTDNVQGTGLNGTKIRRFWDVFGLP